MIDMYLLQFKQVVIESISHPMIPHINVLRSCMKCRILTKVNDALVITVYHIALLLKLELMYETLHPQNSLHASTAAMYFASVVESTHYRIDLDSPISYSMEITLVQSVMSLSCLVFMIDFIFLDQS